MGTKIPSWLKSQLYDWLIAYLPEGLDLLQDSQAPYLDEFAAAVNEGATLQEAVLAFVAATPGIGDDEKYQKAMELYAKITGGFQLAVAAFATQPLMEVIDTHLSGVMIPDFDNDPSNNVSVAALLHDIFEEMAD